MWSHKKRAAQFVRRPCCQHAHSVCLVPGLCGAAHCTRVTVRCFWTLTSLVVGHSTSRCAGCTQLLSGKSCSVQRTTCSAQRTTCSAQYATYNVQRATYNVQRAICNVQRSTIRPFDSCAVERSSAGRMSGTATHSMQDVAALIACS
jgi:hypothetical protein